MKLSQLSVANGECTLVYAQPKVGKSHFIASAAVCGRLVVIASRNGLLTYTGAEVIQAIKGYDPESIDFRIVDRDSNWSEIRAFEEINSICRDLFSPKELPNWDILALDDSTFMKLAARNMAVKANGNADRSKTFATEVAKMAGRMKFNATAVLTESDFGKEMEYVFNFFDELTNECRKHGKQLIVAAHEAVIYVDAKRVRGSGDIPQKDMICAAFTGKKEPTANDTHFDNVIRLTAEGKGINRKIIAQCRSDGVVSAGNRSGVLKQKEENLTFGELLKRTKAQVAGSSQEVPRPPKKVEET